MLFYYIKLQATYFTLLFTPTAQSSFPNPLLKISSVPFRSFQWNRDHASTIALHNLSGSLSSFIQPHVCLFQLLEHDKTSYSRVFAQTSCKSLSFPFSSANARWAFTRHFLGMTSLKMQTNSSPSVVPGPTESSITWELMRNAILRPHPIPPESETGQV